MRTIHSRLGAALLLAFGLLRTAHSQTAAPTPLPETRAERSQWRETSLEADVGDFIRSLEEHFPGSLRVESMGRSSEGRDIPLLLLSADGRFSPEAAREAGRPVVMVIANIHAGEVDGKEALLMVARDLLSGRLPPHHRSCLLVLAPNYNPDGNERIDAKNRSLHLKELWGQMGPEAGVGQRPNAQNIDLNRDYMALRAPESQALAAAYRRFWPDVFVDCHTTNGSIHAYELTYDTAHALDSAAARPILYARDTLLPAISRAVEDRSGLRSFFYGNFRDNADPSSGWETYPALPRYGSNYRGLTGRIDILLESYSYASFETRCRVDYEWLREIFAQCEARAAEIRAITSAAEAETIRRGADPAPDDRVGIDYGEIRRGRNDRLVRAFPVHPLRPCEILAFDLESMRAHRVPGQEQVVWKQPFYARFLPTRTVRRPRAYVIPAGAEAVLSALARHGIRTETLQSARKAAEIENDTLVDRTPRVPEGRGNGAETIFWVRREMTSGEVAVGEILVPMDQPLANVAIYLLEPESDDGLVTWGAFEDLEVGSGYPVRRVMRW